MTIRTTKTSKLRFIEYIPSGGLLLQVPSAFGTKGYPPSLADFPFWANGTNVMSVITIRTIRLWYAGTIRQIPENFDVSGARHTLLPGKYPRAFRSEITIGLSVWPGNESSRSPVFSISLRNPPN